MRSSPPDMFGKSCHRLLTILLSLGFYSGRCQRVHIHLQRIAMSDIPDCEDEHKQWLFKQFQKKDK